MRASQEAIFLQYQRRYRNKHNRTRRPLSGLLVSVAVSLIIGVQMGGLL